LFLLEVSRSASMLAVPVACANYFTGCDKTTPAQLMGGISANKPIVQLVTGPMMPGSHKGTRVGACTDCRNNWAKYRAGTIDIEEISAINEELAPTVRAVMMST
jgi:dihydroxy-acid dehydratase